jgi:hypothetical protein
MPADVARVKVRLFAVVRREEGIALVMALVFMTILLSVSASLIYYSTANVHGASYSTANQNAYRLAEAGINNSFSVIATAGADTTKVKAQPAYAGDPNSTVVTFSSGTATWGGSYDSSTRIWTVKSIGSVRNPTGSANVTRTATATIQLNGNPPPYSFVALNGSCDPHTLTVNSSGTLVVTSNMYINSCNANHDGFDVFGAGGSISSPDIRVVGGWETHNGDIVTVNGTACPILAANPPQSPITGCPLVGQPVLADPFAGQINAPSLDGTGACITPVYGTAVSYAPKVKLATAITSSQTVITTDTTSAQNGDVVLVDTEWMLVTGGGGTNTLTVQRAYGGTTAASHASGKELKLVPVTGTTGTAASPAPCEPTGTVTLQPGTYYGGICIGAASGHDCGSNIGGTCTTSGTSANVTLAPGTYIMAGGGFFVCGSAALSAPDVLIYNTQDPSHTAGSGAIDSVLIDTTGSVTLGPQNTGVYLGLTIFQDISLAVAAGSTCDSRKDVSKVDDWDIGFVSMASSGADGALGSVSGTIYGPANRTMFGETVSGKANLAVMTSCISIDGGNSTFDYKADGLFGVGIRVIGQWG